MTRNEVIIHIQETLKAPIGGRLDIFKVKEDWQIDRAWHLSNNDPFPGIARVLSENRRGVTLEDADSILSAFEQQGYFDSLD